MKPLSAVLSIILISLSCSQQLDKSNMEVDEITFTTSDSVVVFAQLHVVDKSRASILLFHQGGSNGRGEYRDIVPKLVEDGYNVLAVDMRTGGQLYGSYNRTVAQFESKQWEYCDAYPDVEAALDYMIAQGFSGQIILWGSSFSAALVVQLGAKRPNDVAGVLAFSPASSGPMTSCNPNTHFSELEIPSLILRPKPEMEFDSSIAQFALADSLGIQTYVADQGVHGSSMLVDARISGDATETWNVVLGYLNSL